MKKFFICFITICVLGACSKTVSNIQPETNSVTRINNKISFNTLTQHYEFTGSTKSFPEDQDYIAVSRANAYIDSISAIAQKEGLIVKVLDITNNNREDIALDSLDMPDPSDTTIVIPSPINRILLKNQRATEYLPDSENFPYAYVSGYCTAPINSQMLDHTVLHTLTTSYSPMASTNFANMNEIVLMGADQISFHYTNTETGNISWSCHYSIKFARFLIITSN